MIHFKSTATICLLLLTIGVNAQQNLEKLLKNTNWIQEGYGRCLKIEDSTYTYYNIDRLNCKALAEGTLSGRFRIISLNKEELVLNPGGIVNYTFRKVNSLPPICATTSSPTASYEENFNIFWETFNHNYAFFKERNIDWEKIYNDYLPRVKKIDSQKELADILIEIVKKIGDGHIRLDIPDSLKTKTAATIQTTTHTQKQLFKDIQDKYLAHADTYNNGLVNWGKLKGSNTGYIQIKDMNNFANYTEQQAPDFMKKYDKVKDSKDPLTQFDDEHKGVDQLLKNILSALDSTDAMVIDLRFNGGGLETVALKILSYFVAEPKPILSIRAKTAQGNTKKQNYILQPASTNYKGKVYLLVGPNTASAAEIFALGAKNYPITLVGSRTAGIFSEILWKELPNGWEFSLSNEIYTDPKGKTYEGTGIPVNQEMDYPRNRLDFYNSFYAGDHFSDVALDRIIAGTIK